jgi:cysteine desulfurase
VRSIYLDYNATTPLDPGARAAMLPFLDEVWGNPSSVHHVGRRARALLDELRERTAAVWACKPGEVVFTSGGTEANNLAILGAARHVRDKGRHLVTSAVEHHAVLHPCEYLANKEGFELSVVPVDATGRVVVEDVAKAIRPDTVLVSVMAANNEVGTIQPVAEIGAICRERGVLFHTDAVQWFGKEPFADIHQFQADLVSFCAHKLHGPKGAGALFVRSPLSPAPVALGGAHENERRAGTENLAAMAGLVIALEHFVKEPVFPREPLKRLASRLISLLQCLPGVSFRGSQTERLANTVSFTVEGTDSIALLAALDLEGICASSGSACSSGSLTPSHVISAMGASAAEANALVRLSLGRATTDEEISLVCSLLPDLLARVREHPRQVL